MRACLEPLGGMRAFVKPGQRVLFKPNLLSSFGPDRAATTHPSIVRAAILLAQEAGGKVFVGDSPGMGSLGAVANACGLAPVLKETGAELLDFSTPHEYEVPSHALVPKVVLTKALLEVDVLITLPKLKTHSQMVLTAALKNQYGLIPGALKSQWHFRLQEQEWLAALILDVNRTARPALAIMDAIVGMEGPGPSSGKPRAIGALLASSDLAAIDTVACQLIHLNPMQVPLLVAAQKHGYGQTDPKAIKTLGDDWRKLSVPDFEKVKNQVNMLRLLPLPQPVLRWIRSQWTTYPSIEKETCTRCGICSKVCPVSPAAIQPRLESDQVDHDRCIACYCCHEFCPNKAIALAPSRLARLLPLTALANWASRLIAPRGK